jgi:hypothetical protein
MADPNAFAKLVPGFDFLQGLMGGAAQAVPGMSSWMAPTLDPAELDKRIDELRTVQFWLEQNARMIATTIQALEVQRMTLGTLRQMNLSIGDMAKAMQLPDPVVAAPAPAPVMKAVDPASAEVDDSSKTQRAAPQTEPSLAAAGIVDPMQWWGALTQQFTALAAKAVRESSGEARVNPQAKPAKTAGGAGAATAASSAKRPAARKAATKTPRTSARPPARGGP